MTMTTLDLRNMILNTPLREQPVTIAEWPTANLIIRELSGKAGSDLLAACTDADGKMNQDNFIAAMILSTLRNADEPNKALVFAKDPANDPDNYDPAYRDSLMSTGLGWIMEVSQLSIKLSGLDNQTAVQDAKNASSATVAVAQPSQSPAS